MAKAAYWTTTDAEARKRGEQTGLDTLGESLMQRRRVSEEVFRYVKLYQQGR